MARAERAGGPGTAGAGTPRPAPLHPGVPVRVEGFLFAPAPLETGHEPNALIGKFLRDEAADLILCTHTASQWHRVPAGDRHLVNVATVGGTANDGPTNVRDALLTATDRFAVELVPVLYDQEPAACQMEPEGLP